MRMWKVIMLFVIYSGCTTIVDLDIPGGYQSRMVIESLFSPDSLWTFRVGKSIELSETVDPRDLIITDALIVISGDDQTIDTLEYIDNGIYRSAVDRRPTSGATYRVYASAAGFDEQLEAVSWAPPLHSELLAINRVSADDSLDNDQFAVRLRLTDLPGKNYYSLTLYQVVPYCRDETGLIKVEDGFD